MQNKLNSVEKNMLLDLINKESKLIHDDTYSLISSSDFVKDIRRTKLLILSNIRNKINHK